MILLTEVTMEFLLALSGACVTSGSVVFVARDVVFVVISIAAQICRSRGKYKFKAAKKKNAGVTYRSPDPDLFVYT